MPEKRQINVQHNNGLQILGTNVHG